MWVEMVLESVFLFVQNKFKQYENGARHSTRVQGGPNWSVSRGYCESVADRANPTDESRALFFRENNNGANRYRL